MAECAKPDANTGSYGNGEVVSIAQHRFSRMPVTAVVDPRLCNAARRVLAALAMYADRNGVTWVAAETIAKRLGVTRPAIVKQIRQLERLGYVETRRRRRPQGGYDSNLYVLRPPAEVPMPKLRARKTSSRLKSKVQAG